MRIIIFHYHLNPGGVTRVIESQIKTLRQLNSSPEIMLLTGHCDNPSVFEDQQVRMVTNESLNYLTKEKDVDETYIEVSKVFEQHIQPGDILHFHNLNLGKNPLVTLAIAEYVKQGFHMINHAHDFSEDRPVNQEFMKEIIQERFNSNLEEVMYPNVSNYHYAVLNSTDLKRLVNYGISEDRINLMPNPVVFNTSEGDGSILDRKREICIQLGISEEKPLITYPVRVIRRKNIGEFILLATLFPDANWVVTQPPKNPIEIEPYKEWMNFTSENDIAIGWEAGTKVDFERLLTVSDFCISTSIQEGFGMVFMEPWLLNTPVIGRNIPMVTEDMIKSGLEFTCLYDKLIVSEDIQLHELDIREQMHFILSVKNDPATRKGLLEGNPTIKNLLNLPDKDLIARNKAVILNDYSLENYGKRLDEAYRRIVK